VGREINSVLDEIKERLISGGVEKLILFGSYAYGTPNEDSDIDLLVVTSDETIPASFSEKAKIDISISRLIEHIRWQIPVDLIVHTKAMHQKFLDLNSMFCREIMARGKVLYEK